MKENKKKRARNLEWKKMLLYGSYRVRTSFFVWGCGGVGVGGVKTLLCFNDISFKNGVRMFFFYRYLFKIELYRGEEGIVE